MVNVTEIQEGQRDFWDREISRFENAHPLNAFDWGQVRSIDNWKSIYLLAQRDGVVCGGMMILVKKLPFVPLTILYSPKGPVWQYEDEETLTELIKSAKRRAKQEKAIFLRIDPNIPESIMRDKVDLLEKQSLIHLEQRWTFWNSPRDVYRIDLTKVQEPEELFNRLDRDTRRCVRKAAKEGVSIEAAEKEEELKTFYEIFKEFSVSKGFMSRSYEYQKKLWDTYIKQDKGRLFLAKYQGKIIGGLICIMFSDKCLAMHMGTPYEYRRLQTYYAYVWASIKWAKERGCQWYSFRGVGTTPSQEYFKSKFLPEVVSLVGYYDLPNMTALYRAFYFAEFYILPRAWKYLISIREMLHKFFSKYIIRHNRAKTQY